jgi:DNA-binding response OmpR family regulator
MGAPRLLVAEDEPHILRTLQFILEKEGWEVLLSRDGDEALDVARRERPDLLLMDIMMPRRDGLEVLRELRQTEGFESVPVILLTAMADSRDKVKGLEIGADDYLTKPFDPREVVARARAQLRIRQMQSELLSAERARVALETAGAAAHEMSQPLTVMMGSVDLLLLRMTPDDPLREVADKLRRNGERAIGLLRRLQSVQRYATKQYAGDSSILDLERASSTPGTSAGEEDGGT